MGVVTETRLDRLASDARTLSGEISWKYHALRIAILA